MIRVEIGSPAQNCQRVVYDRAAIYQIWMSWSANCTRILALPKLFCIARLELRSGVGILFNVLD